MKLFENSKQRCNLIRSRFKGVTLAAELRRDTGRDKDGNRDEVRKLVIGAADQGGSRGGSEKWSSSGYKMKVE